MPRYSSLVKDVANFLVVELYGDNGQNPSNATYQSPEHAALLAAVKANMPVIGKLTEDQLADLCSGEESEATAFGKANLPAWSVLNTALNNLFDAFPL